MHRFETTNPTALVGHLFRVNSTSSVGGLALRSRGWAIVLIAALVGRGFATSISFDRVPYGDAYNTLTIVENMLSGRGMVADSPSLGSLYAMYPPLYPTLLYVFSWIGGVGQVTIVSLNFACDLATAAGIIWLGRQIGIGRAAHFAAAAYLLWPTNIIISPLAQKEPLVSCLVVLCFCALIQASKDRRFIPFFGAISGFLALTQPALAPLPAVASIFVWREFKTGHLWATAMAYASLVALAIMLPWWVRNWMVLDAFIPFTTTPGVGLWIGAAPWGDGTYIPVDPKFLGKGEIAMSNAAADEALTWVAADPITYLTRCSMKILRAFAGDFWPIHSLTVRYPQLAAAAIPAVLAPAGLYAGSMAALYFNRNPILVRLLGACLAEILLFQFWFEFAERHRYFLTPLLLLIAFSIVRKAKAPKSSAHANIWPNHSIDVNSASLEPSGGIGRGA